MERIETFLDMGGYGAFVWPAYAITALVMVALAISTLRRLARNRKRVDELEAARSGRPGENKAGKGKEGAAA